MRKSVWSQWQVSSNSVREKQDNRRSHSSNDGDCFHCQAQRFDSVLKFHETKSARKFLSESSEHNLKALLMKQNKIHMNYKEPGKGTTKTAKKGKSLLWFHLHIYNHEPEPIYRFSTIHSKQCQIHARSTQSKRKFYETEFLNRKNQMCVGRKKILVFSSLFVSMMSRCNHRRLMLHSDCIKTCLFGFRTSNKVFPPRQLKSNQLKGRK